MTLLAATEIHVKIHAKYTDSDSKTKLIHHVIKSLQCHSRISSCGLCSFQLMWSEVM